MAEEDKPSVEVPQPAEEGKEAPAPAAPAPDAAAAPAADAAAAPAPAPDAAAAPAPDAAAAPAADAAAAPAAEAAAAAEGGEAPAEEMPSGDESSEAESEEEEEEEEEVVPAVPKISPFARLKTFLAETNKFLAVFDDVVENRDQHKSVYLNVVNALREPLVTLLNRYILHTMVREDFLYKHIRCCGEPEDDAMNTEEFDEHYEEAHKEADSSISLPELTTIQEYTQLVEEYIEEGKAMNNDLIFSLKRLLRKSNTVLAGHLG